MQRSRDAACPFFRKSIGNAVNCEGPFDGAYIRLIIPDKDAMDKHMQNYCNNRYACCEVYRMVMDAKYEDEK